jgi:hypothetical protein
MDRKFVSLFLAAVSLPIVLAAGSANACDEPGTPTNVTAGVTSYYPPTITVSWINKANNDETVFWDVQITDGKTPPTFFNPPPPPGSGRPGTMRDQQMFGSFAVTWPTGVPAGTGVTRCFEIKARTGQGTQGCLSKIFSNKDCVTTTSSPTIEFPRALYALNIDEPLDASNTAIDVPLTFRDCLLLVNGCPVTPEVEQWTYDPFNRHLLHAPSGKCVSIGAEGDPSAPVILSGCGPVDPGTSLPRRDAWGIQLINGSNVWIIQNDQTQMCLHAVPGVFNPGGKIVQRSPAKLVQQQCHNTNAQMFGPADAEWVRQHPN